MNWNEWRKFCSENGLSLDQASETWQNYKELREEADRAALDVVHNMVYGEDEEEEEYNPVEEILDAKEELADMFSGEAILETDAIKLFEQTDKVSEALVESLQENSIQMGKLLAVHNEKLDKQDRIDAVLF